MKNRHLLVILLFLLDSCQKEYYCNEFNMDNSFLKIAISPSSQDTLTFESDTGGQINLQLNYSNISDSYTLKCSGFSPGCKCHSKFEQIYLGPSSDFYCGIHIDIEQEVDDNNELFRYSFFSQRVFYNSADFFSQSYTVEQFIDSIVYDSISYDGNYYTEIFELTNDTIGSDYINKFWIKKDVGLYKFWKNNICWTLVE